MEHQRKEGFSIDMDVLKRRADVDSFAPETDQVTDCDSSSIGQLGKFKQCAVSSDSPLCSRIGREILERGGSAADAAIATMLCLNVINCHNLGIGGGVLATVYQREEKKFYTLDARETAPFSSSRDMFKENPADAVHGPRSIAVPGQIAGFWELHQKFGKLPWKELFIPCIDLCQNGFEIRKCLHESLVEVLPNMDASDMEPFLDQKTGLMKQIGDVVKLPKVAKTLQDIAEHGGESFYSGKLSDKIIDELNEVGAIITKTDLEEYKPKWRVPVLMNMNVKGRNMTLGTMPPPCGGILIGFIIKTLSGFETNVEDFVDDPVKYWHRFMEVSKVAYGARAEFGDEDFVDIRHVMQQLSSDDFITRIRSKILENSTHPHQYYGNHFSKTKTHGTSHLNILSENGDAVSITGSHNQYFASGVIGKETGIIYNDTMDDFSQPGETNVFGLPAGEANFIEAGKRPMSSMSPVILTDEKGDVRFVCGASGGSRIISCVAQIMWRSLFLDQDLKEATDARRILELWMPDPTLYEKGVDEHLIERLRKLGHKLAELSAKDYLASVAQSIEKKDGWVYAYAEPRKGGSVDGF